MQGLHGGDVYRNHVKKDFSVNINPLGMPDSVKKALHNAVEHCIEYPDIQAEELKKEVGSMLNVPKEYLLFGNGASELFMAIVHALKPGKTIIPVPSFYGYEHAAMTAEGTICFHFLNEKTQFQMNEYLEEVLTEKADLLFLANPNNPTGALLNKETLKKLLDVCKSKNIKVVLDECFIDFSGKDCSMLHEIEKYDNLMIVRAFTKIFAIPGVRLGYLVCSNQELLRKVARQLPEWNLSILAQNAGCACAKQSSFIEKTVEYVKRERAFLENGMKQLGLRVYPSKANFILFYSDSPLLHEKLLERGFLIRNCENFRGLSEGYFRIAVKNRKDNEMFLKALRECVLAEMEK